MCWNGDSSVSLSSTRSSLKGEICRLVYHVLSCRSATVTIRLHCFIFCTLYTRYLHPGSYQFRFNQI